MTVTFTIRNNIEYVDENLRHLIECEMNECLCVQSPGEDPDPKCPWCKGTGSEMYCRYPFELNVSNQSFEEIVLGLGLRDLAREDFLDPEIVLQRLAMVPKAGFERPTEEGVGKRGARWVDVGVSPERVGRWYAGLESIAREARRRGETVVWY